MNTNPTEPISESSILIIVGTNRKNSMSRHIADYYYGILQQLGVSGEILDLSGLPPDFVTTALYENTGKNPEFNRYKEVVERAKKMVFIVPEYNNSYPGVLKAFIDGLSYPSGLANKKIALVGLSANHQGGALALSHLNDIFSYLNSNTLALRVKLAQIRNYWKEGTLDNDLYNTLLRQQAQQLIDF
ncbi:NAD(P)H-dependent FMN reductase [Larkinella arboricola]|uniref:NAD(P)H-dependent FMN reductase n=1 Tax=Larkinella arboricola TaxID=643671 RepID=A0A327WXW8_LARAB|nr:NAD(P)H-dependent oxidoreductase [Larkinella arboricola]RAJ98011.1 NAD(P)H-dependent FMN reductase [Larkinella arboricola]